MEHTFEELKKKTVNDLREIAKGIEGVTGYSQLNKEHLLETICKALHIEMHAHHEVVGAARSISCPWLIIHGAEDPVVPVGDATFLAANAPDGELVVHPTAGHRFDQPGERKWLIERVAGFLGRIGEPDAPIAKGRGGHL